VSPRRAVVSGPGAGIRGFGNVGYGWFEAHRGFNAVLAHPGGLWFGGGGEYHAKSGLFVQGWIERFRQTGERVFVFNGNVFKLGIADTITITPVAGTVGYRFSGGRGIPYVGGGAGRYFFSEKSAFADLSDNVNSQFTSYHVVAGVEWRGDDWFATAIEALYTHVPTDLATGALTAFGERSLGGVQVRVKILVGK
jgi:hypothetical protein